MSTPGYALRMRLTGRAATFCPRNENGAVAIMTAAALIVITGFCGLALELSQVYNRKMELQNVVDVSALAAARELNGTRAGITNAVQAASARFAGSREIAVTYQYGRTMTWSEAAIEFGSTRNGPWVSAGTAQTNPGQHRYARVSTEGLDPSYSQIRTFFLQVLSQDLATVLLSARAIAGASAIKVIPLGVCAMRSEEKRNRNGELEEYGFRRGVGYDLMQLNPDGTGSGQAFLINPIAAPGAIGVQASNLDTVRPFVCTGTMGIPRITGGQVSISPFPLEDLLNQLNSRFVANNATCNTDVAPPDFNVKRYVFNTSVPWMSTARDGQSAALSLAEGKRWTVAGPDPTPDGTTVGMYGPLWSYAKAVHYAETEPSGGYTTYGTAKWNNLYNPGQPTATSYPSSTPYMQSSGTNFQTPTGARGVRHRRVLNVPLLGCPVSGGRATVLGIGRFFMTVPADSTHLFAEFAGLAAEQPLNIQTRLYP